MQVTLHDEGPDGKLLRCRIVLLAGANEPGLARLQAPLAKTVAQRSRNQAMTKIALPLQKIAIASPCRASWEEMAGDDRVRHCGLCRMNVYNLSAMSRSEAEEVVEATEGRRCVRSFCAPTARC